MQRDTQESLEPWESPEMLELQDQEALMDPSEEEDVVDQLDSKDPLDPKDIQDLMDLMDPLVLVVHLESMAVKVQTEISGLMVALEPPEQKERLAHLVLMDTLDQLAAEDQ